MPPNLLTAEEAQKNLSDYFEQKHLIYSKILYSNLLKQGKFLYVLESFPAAPIHVIALKQKERTEDDRGLILDQEDIKDLYKIFPRCFVEKHPQYIINRYRVKNYTWDKKGHYLNKEPIHDSELEELLHNNPILI